MHASLCRYSSAFPWRPGQGALQTLVRSTETIYICKMSKMYTTYLMIYQQTDTANHHNFWEYLWIVFKASPKWLCTSIYSSIYAYRVYIWVRSIGRYFEWQEVLYALNEYAYATRAYMHMQGVRICVCMYADGKHLLDEGISSITAWTPGCVYERLRARACNHVTM
jgi:hypothetical protein